MDKWSNLSFSLGGAPAGLEGERDHSLLIRSVDQAASCCCKMLDRDSGRFGIGQCQGEADAECSPLECVVPSGFCQQSHDLAGRASFRPKPPPVVCADAGARWMSGTDAASHTVILTIGFRPVGDSTWLV